MSFINYLKSAKANVNIKAVQHTIRQCEGTNAADGYNYLFSSSIHNLLRFTDMSKHPNRHIPYGNTYSDAAGAYQIMYATEQGLIKQLVQAGLSLAEATWFDAPTQDLKCVLLFSNHNVCQQIMDGHFEHAISVLNKTWASLPGSPYNQPTKSLAQATEWYINSGGIVV